VRGAVGHPSAAQFDSSAFVILVNGRLVSDRMILRAVKDGFDSTLKEREFPVGFIHIQIPSAELDVNVHPQKSEVRFRDGGRVFALVRETVLRAVRSFSSPMRPSGPEAPLPGYRSITEPMPSRETNEVPQHVYRASGFGAPAPQTKLAFQSAAGTQAHPAICSGAEAHSESKKTPSEPRFSELRYVGQVLSCYLVCEWQEALYVVDMHAAHERYNYNVIRQRLRDKQADSQQLLVPMVVELSELGVEHCMNLLPQFQTVGFEWEALGSTALVVRAVPSFFKDAHVVSVLRDIAALAASELTPASFEQEVDHIAARLACHASIRSGRELEKEEVYALFAAMDSSEFSAACPHGRPVIVRFAREDIEAWFGRDC
jgi:DNA mismatch repair protein MutL